jgi:hypothetical protein
MARRRMISENLLYDPQFNQLSIPAQNLFIRMLIKTDDYGVIPADQWTMLNLPQKVFRELVPLIGEITEAGLIVGFLHEDKPFFVFKRGRFDEYQSYLIQKRRRSEYLRLDKEEMDGDVFQEILGKSWKFYAVTPVTNREYRVQSRKKKDTADVKPSGSAFSPQTSFESVWAQYPRQEGKKEAFKHYVASVKDEADHARVLKALGNYKAKLLREKTEPRFIQKGSTWFNNWQDWENQNGTEKKPERSGYTLLKEQGLV